MLAHRTLAGVLAAIVLAFAAILVIQASGNEPRIALAGPCAADPQQAEGCPEFGDEGVEELE